MVAIMAEQAHAQIDQLAPGQIIGDARFSEVGQRSFGGRGARRCHHRTPVKWLL